MQENNKLKSDNLKLAVRLFLITFVAALVLAVANFFTAPIISNIEKKDYEAALREVYPKADSFEAVDKSKVDEIKKKIKNIENIEYAKSEDKKVGIVFKTVGKNGYGGDIVMLMGVDLNSMEIVGFKVLKHSETPGLGSRVALPQYAESVKGNKANDHLVKNLNPTADNDIQAITGTTISVNAVLNGLNAAIDAIKLVK